MTTIGMLIFDGAEELDFVGPWEVFTMAAKMRDDIRVVTIAERAGPGPLREGHARAPRPHARRRARARRRAGAGRAGHAPRGGQSGADRLAAADRARPALGDERVHGGAAPVRGRARARPARHHALGVRRGPAQALPGRRGARRTCAMCATSGSAPRRGSRRASISRSGSPGRCGASRRRARPSARWSTIRRRRTRPETSDRREVALLGFRQRPLHAWPRRLRTAFVHHFSNRPPRSQRVYQVSIGAARFKRIVFADSHQAASGGGAAPDLRERADLPRPRARARARALGGVHRGRARAARRRCADRRARGAPVRADEARAAARGAARDALARESRARPRVPRARGRARRRRGAAARARSRASALPRRCGSATTAPTRSSRTSSGPRAARCARSTSRASAPTCCSAAARRRPRSAGWAIGEAIFCRG